MSSSDIDLPEVRTHLHAVEVVVRDGFKEFRCTPTTWSYPQPRPFGALLVEFYSERMGVDPNGAGRDRNFWSGSDAALRLQDIAPTDLALREMTVIATRRSVGINAPKPWIAQSDVIDLAHSWESEATDVHWTQRIPEESAPSDTWTHYGMATIMSQGAITSYYFMDDKGVRVGSIAPMRGSGPGMWYSWSTVADWTRWPRRQDAHSHAYTAGPAALRLFISHPWEALEHPDPAGLQLLALKVGLTLALACACGLNVENSGKLTASGLPEVIAQHVDMIDPALRPSAELQGWAARVRDAASSVQTEEDLSLQLDALETPALRPLLDRIRSSIVVWYDYASMYQMPRTVAEQTDFAQEIQQLNVIQASACTVVLAGKSDYLVRAWCFLELCGGMRGTITELTPTWGRSVGASRSLTRWGSRSDQLIGALNSLGLDAIHHSGLGATHAEDLPVIASLLAQLPVTGRIESDESDLLGGAIPIPFREGRWVVETTAEPPPLEHLANPLPDYGRIAAQGPLRRAAQQCDDLAVLSGTVGLWIYTTQYALSHSWADRADEIWSAVQDQTTCWIKQLDAGEAGLSVACTWADSRALADDGNGWTRVVASTVRVLVIVTQPALPALCRIYERILGSHLAAGVPVITYMPSDGHLLLHLPPEQNPTRIDVGADVLAVPRIRRAYAYPRNMLLRGGATRDQVALLSALRLEPAEGFVRIDRTGSGNDLAAGLTSSADDPQDHLLAHAEQRARVEGLTRATTASWDTWCAPRLHRSAWETGIAPVQLDVMEGVVRAVFAVSDNPFVRRRLLYVAVEDEAGYALPPSIVGDVEHIVNMVREGSLQGDQE